MGRDRPDHVVHLDHLHQLESRRAQDTADRADDDGPVVVDDIGARGYGHQSGDGPVQAGKQRHAAKNGTGNGQGRHDPRGGCEVGVDQHVAYGHGVQGAAQRKLGPAVEAEPPKPQDEDAQGHNQHVGGRRCADAAVAPELAKPRADHNHASQCGPAARAMDDRGASEVLEPQTIEPAASPRPRAHYGVDEAGQDERDEEEGPELHALGDGAGHYGRGSRHEHHLEEPVGHCGVAAINHPRGRLALPANQGHLVRGRAVEELEGADHLADVHVHQVVADEEVGQPCDGVDADVLHADHGGVLGANCARLQHGEAGAHPHHERTPHQEGEGVEDELRLLVDALGVGDGRPRQEVAHAKHGDPPHHHHRPPAAQYRTHRPPPERIESWSDANDSTAAARWSRLRVVLTTDARSLGQPSCASGGMQALAVLI